MKYPKDVIYYKYKLKYPPWGTESGLSLNEKSYLSEIKKSMEFLSKIKYTC